MSIPFIDLKFQYQLAKQEIDVAIQKVLDHGQYIMGPEVTQLEQELADYVGVKHALSCSSGTDALLLPLMTQQLQKNDAIFTVSFTFFATAETIALVGATPVFVDVDETTFNMDASHLEASIQQVIEAGELTPRGIIPVDLFGLPADYDAINAIAEKYDLFVLEDAAQGFAADYHGKKAGSLAQMAATSFFPAKPLGAYGDGGAVFTDDTDLYDEFVSLRVHGQSKVGDKYDNVTIGLNARMDTIQAAILLEKLKLYGDELEKRNAVAGYYSEKLTGLVDTPDIPDGYRSVWAQYSVLSDKREQIRQALGDQGIPTAVYYPVPIHLSTAFQSLGYGVGDLPVTEKLSKKIFSLPMHPYLEQEQIDMVAKVIEQNI